MKRLPSPLLPLVAVLPIATACTALPPAGEPVTQRLVAEDQQVRIDELRVRGQTQRLTVQPKQGGRPYEIVAPTGGQDPSRDKSTAGQRVWPLLSF